MDRVYESVIQEHFDKNRQMFFLMGPRQVGKTFSGRRSAQALGGARYLNWDNADHRRQILRGPQAIAETIGLDHLLAEKPTCLLDELHKHSKWKDLLKGLFDTFGDQMRLLVTGSARMEVFASGGDSLTGRYFAYRMHPLSVGELVNPRLGPELIREPSPIDDEAFDALLRFGGYPEPLLKNSERFWRQWSRSRRQQLLRDDLRDLTRIRELGQVEVLCDLIREGAGQLTVQRSFAQNIGASQDSIRRWLDTLKALYFCFALRPWYRNVTRSLRKEPKYFLWDWSQTTNPGARGENLVASALLKAAQLWTDRGLGDFGVHHLRDKEKHEVDFVMVRDGRPWFLVEVKTSGKASLSPQLRRFQQQTGAPHAFQVAMDLPYVDRDCFQQKTPLIVPARTFLSQLP